MILLSIIINNWRVTIKQFKTFQNVKFPNSIVVFPASSASTYETIVIHL